MKKFYLIIWCSFFFSSVSLAQTIINPVQGGDFDSGNSFAANGWTVVNSSANKWVVGSATSSSEPNSAYISIDGDPGHYSYDNTTSHISHFYQQITLPPNAFNIVISFQLKGNLQSDENNVIDGLIVYADTLLTVPVADALPGSSARMVLSQFAPNEIYVGQNTTLDLLAGKTFFLIFTWVNNGDNTGGGPPASVDDASISYCLGSAKFNVTGGGAFCTGNPGPEVGLDGSSLGISYQLYKNGNPTGEPIDGTGSAINFGPQNTVGSYTVIGTSNCNFGFNTYPMDGIVNINENSPPVATAGSNAPLCLGSVLNLTSGAGTNYTYSWTGPNGFTSIVQNPSIPDFTPEASGSYTVTVTDNGCSATATTNVAISGGGATGGTITSLSVCSGESGSLTLSGNSNTPSAWEYSTDSTSTSWTSIPNTTTTQPFTNLTAPTFYRAIVGDGCGIAYSSIATVSIRNYWTGAIDSDWNTPGNWSDNQLPSISCPNVHIPNTTNKPVLSTGTATIGNLYIDPGAILTVNNTGILQIAAAINNNGTFDAANGTLEFNGTASAQAISGSMFKNKTIKDLIISNSDGLSLSSTANDTLNITDSVSFGVNNAVFTTHNNLTLKSTAAGTASVGVLSSGNDITGNVIVERFINVGTGGSHHGKSWQFVATPTQGQSVWNSWMEGGTVPTGYGTQIIGPGAGMDAVTSLPSLKYYDWQSNNWIGITNTANQLYDKRGYMLFVRGDRSATFPAVNNTTLRTKGTLFTPGNPPPTTTVGAGKFESVGNPYASAIDLRKFSYADGIGKTIIVWDPTITSNAQGSVYGLGAFQTLYQEHPENAGSDYINLLASAAYGPAKTPNNFIQSGQAFFVQAASTTVDGSISFTENMKAGGSKLLLRAGNTNGPAENSSALQATLYGINPDGSAFVTDGNLIQYNEDYSNKIDGLDARKLINSTENLGIKSGGKELVIERRHNIVETDTIFYNLTGVRAQNYLLEFTASHLSAFGVDGYAEDTYLNTQTPLNMDGVTKVNFAVTNAAGSKAANRFRIVFRQAPLLFALPVTFVSVKAYQKDASVAVEWQVENERDMQQYEVEKSTDGVRFTKSATIKAVNDGAQSYQWIDQQATPGINYYRIRSVGKDGKADYSTIVKVVVVFPKPSIEIYPNPITDGTIHLQLINQPEGMYGIRLLNSLGQVIVSKQAGHAGGNTTENIKWDYNLAHGVYHLEVTKPNGEVLIIKVMY
jgi:hypothetical protein